MTGRLETAAVLDALDAQAERLVEQAWGPPVKAGAREWRAQASSAWSVVMRGPKRGRWFDHKAGVGGDLLDFYAVQILGLPNARADFPRVLHEAAGWAGVAANVPVDAVAQGAAAMRRLEREEKARAEEAKAERRKAAVLAELIRRAQPVEGSPAVAYLASRGITRWPGGVLSYLPPCPDLLELGEGRVFGALVAWGTDDAGRVTGLQRILIRDDGGPAAMARRKPSYGHLRGAPVRFPAAEGAGGQLCVAEGPETALSVWLATGLETWAVLSVSNYGNAPIPLGRRVAFCPDRDAPGSEAGMAYAKAVALHLERGADLWQADAPEPVASKADLNDTLRRAGEEAVEAAVRAARPLRTPPVPPFHPPPPPEPHAVAVKRPALAIAGWFGKALPHAQAARDVRRAYDALDPALGNADRRRAQRLIRERARSRFGLDYLPTPELRADQNPPREFHGGAQGTGKTRAAVSGLLAARGLVSLALVPDHPKGEELVAALLAGVDARSPAILRVKGREAQDRATGSTMCRTPAAAKALAELGLSVPATLCVRCPYADVCGYRAQEREVERLAADPAGVVLVAARQFAFLPLPGNVKPDLVVLDEVAANLGHQAEAFTFDALAEPLTYEGSRRRKSRVAEAAEAADARAALLADVRPVLIAIRDAWQEAPAEAMRVLRERGVDEERLCRVRDALHLYADQQIGAKIGAQVDAFAFATQDGQPFNLDRRLLATIRDHEGKRLRALNRLIEAVMCEVRHGRDKPVAVIRAADLSEGRQGVEAHTLLEPHFGPEVPFLHMDGTGDHALAQALFGPLALQWHPVERPAFVTQVIGKTFSAQSITGENGRGDPVWPEEAERLRDDLVAFCHEQPDALVVASKRVVAALKAAGLRNVTAHFGAVRGMNTWEAFQAVIVIGREQPPPRAVEGAGRALAVRAGDVFNPLPPEERWPTESRGIRLRGGGVELIAVERHPDPWADRVLRQIREAEVLQTVDRPRPHFKPEPVRVTLLCPLALDVTVDRVTTWANARRGGSRVELAAARGVVPLSVSEAVRLFPDLWRNRKAAQRDEGLKRLSETSSPSTWVGHLPNSRYSLGNVPGKSGLVLASYTRPAESGHGGSRSRYAALVLASEAEAQAVLEAVTGPIEGFRVESSAAADPEARPAPLATPAAPVVPLPLPDERRAPIPVPAAQRPAMRAGAP